ncbi:SpvB/TcaC N-terminal domain-containing protein [Nitrosomonas ureae]|uniref:RHS repeat-associated core domain-containing protein n=1 Tax=Nitrosomonas ureae TaxID=44577 RepID=A0A1H9GH89_9PROT|nr:SpvB/TcaC N-terminal domain-containing protein [Nitrosomonas ureae]SEQ49474.1 RHS repeat-associated core domain-containing protein [Nitrosomonas ureae]
MLDHKSPVGQSNDSTKADRQSTGPELTKPPAISLPKGGGAIRGIGEKFAANPVTGTGSMTIPIATSPGRSGFGPQLSLSYDSGAGNGPFGLGWSLSLPAITRKTDKGLPRYNDADESDVFILSGAEDLVPEFKKDGLGKWIFIDGKYAIDEKPGTVNGIQYKICRYRPRIEGLFARIERWTNTKGISHWRSISKDNITTLYGYDEKSCVVDPTDKTRIFSWLICESFDDKGNAIRYEYIEEDSTKIDTAQAHERNRNDNVYKTNRYLKSILYGNKQSHLNNPNYQQAGWMFQVIFDYEEKHYKDISLGDDDPFIIESRATVTKPSNWPVRSDPFSSYRAGFEVRTYRLCRRVLMFHNFSELGDTPCLVRSTEFTHEQNSVASLIKSVSQSGYIRQRDANDQFTDRYRKKSLPPVEFTYSQAIINEDVHEVDPVSLENLPQGLDNSRYQWVDLDGEGLSGLLTEQGEAWFYKRNQSAVPVKDAAGNMTTPARFAPLERVATIPSSANLAGGQQLLDLAGDGQLDVVEFDGPAPGFFERTVDEDWETHRSFSSLPNIAWRDPNLKFIDLTGDGHADILITEDEAFSWYPSLAEAGFGPGEKVRQAIDEEQGPRLVFADGTQSIYLADMSGDGLTDLVRIRNGEVCYWPNLGYARFGAKVTMDQSPWFDAPDMFDQRRIRLADIDGSSLVDILYLTGQGVQIYFNQSGNSWSKQQILSTFPRIDNLTAVSTVDLLGNGTACLVWSSPLPGDARSTIRYIDLMGGQKPHLLTGTKNNLGAETKVEYAPSTKFYLQDKQDGKPWITKLPFPVHCVEKVTVTDKWRQTEFSSTYSYHHGYFDGIEREFRGFGRVEQVDIENYDKFEQGNIASPYITNDKTLYQPPIKTITWYHTGAAIDRERILTQFANEYFPARYASNFKEKALPEPELPADLSADEWREALRACKGMVLRQESYELDVDALHSDNPKDIPVRIYSAATHNCQIQRLQPHGDNKHAVFLVTESEALSYQYELALPKESVQVSPDPRIAHTLNLRYDEYGNPQQSIAIAYGRVASNQNANLPQADLIDHVQQETHIAYTETRYTKDFILPAPGAGTNPIKHHRLKLPYEVRTYEITGIPKPTNRYFNIGELRKYVLCEDTLYPPPVPTNQQINLTPLLYHEQPRTNDPHRRKVEHACTLFFDDEDDNTGVPKIPTNPLPLGHHGPRGLKYEDYKLALTEILLTDVLNEKFDASVRAALNKDSTSIWPQAETGFLVSGYQTDSELFRTNASARQWWMRSGIAGFANDAAENFYLPEKYTDPFGNITKLTYYRPYNLFIQSSTDALGNKSEIAMESSDPTDPMSAKYPRFDYRVLAPIEMVDPNDNRTEVYFDILGMVVALAVKGMGDNLDSFDDNLANLSDADVQTFCTSRVMSERQAEIWLNDATARFVYHFGEPDRPPGACGIARERHVSQLATGEKSELQVSLECSDGSGNVLMKKVQAEPAPGQTGLRWIINGLTVLNNKGKPVKQYEPSFSEQGFGCESPPAVGVTSILYYDAAGRVIRTEMPDGTFSRVEFSPWHVKTFDTNDNLKESRWYAERLTAVERGVPLYAPNDTIEQKQEKDKAEEKAVNAKPEAKRAAHLAANHANTPALILLDSLGREVIAIAHNRTPDAGGNWQDDYYTTFTKLDAEGKPLWIRDARGNLVMQYITPARPNNATGDDMPANAAPCYDIAGNLLFQHSMDAGERWMLMDAAGKPMLAWDEYKPKDDEAIVEKRLYATDYDQLHRPTAQWLTIDAKPRVKFERYEYQDAVRNDANNLNGQLITHFDSSGLLETVRRDFKGNVEEVKRTLNNKPKESFIDWNTDDPAPDLEKETFIQITEYDALNRMTKLFNWHRIGKPVAVYIPVYGKRGVLKSERLIVGANKDNSPEGYRGGTENDAIQDIRYDAKGQRQYLKLGNDVITTYTYDKETFRLTNLHSQRTKQETCNAGTSPMFVDSRIVQDLNYWYDPVGNITEITDPAFEKVHFNGQEVKPINQYEYDALYRLIMATGRENGAASGAPTHKKDDLLTKDFPCIADNAFRNYTQRYQYDAVGNIKQMGHEAGSNGGSWTRDYAYAFEDNTQQASNRLWQTWTGDDRTNAVTYRYDSHGSMLNLANVADEFLMQWDHCDMIASINLGGGGIAYYQYDANKQRTRKYIEKNNGNIVEERIYLGGLEIFRQWVNGDLEEEIETLHVFDGEQRLLMVDQIDDVGKGKSTLYRYTLSNHLGSSTLELDDQAKLISYEEYHPYGTSAYRAGRNAAEVKLKRYRYTGMERDEESGLGYHGARYYLPWLGRWLSFDPSGLSDGINGYVGIGNSPVIFNDITGQAAEVPGGQGPTSPIPGGPFEPIKIPWGEPIGTPEPPRIVPYSGPVVGLTAGELTAAGGSVAGFAGGAALLVAVLLIPVGIFIAGDYDIKTRTARYEAEAKIGHEKYIRSLSPAEQYFLSAEDKSILASGEPVEIKLPTSEGKEGKKGKLPTSEDKEGKKGKLPTSEDKEGKKGELPTSEDKEGKKGKLPGAKPVGDGQIDVAGPRTRTQITRLKTDIRDLRDNILRNLPDDDDFWPVVLWDALLEAGFSPDKERGSMFLLDILRQMKGMADEGNDNAKNTLEKILPETAVNQLGELIAKEKQLGDIDPIYKQIYRRTIQNP